MSLSLSVATICFNNLAELQTTCASVDRQLRKPDEHIIIDGSTQPHIKNWLEQSPQPPYRKWICERDKGISDAFNKGVLHSSSTVVHLLNSGDRYYDEHAVQSAMQTLETHLHARWLHGRMSLPRGGIKVVVGAPFERSKLYRGFRTLNHQTFFVYKSLYEKHGLFSLDKKIAMDYDFLVRIADEPFVFCESIISDFEGGGNSEQKAWAGLKEVVASYESRFGFSIGARLWAIRTWMIGFATANTALGKWLFQQKNKKNQIRQS